MKILVYGDAAPGSGGWCYSETLREMGHDVLSVEDPDSSRQFRSFERRVFRKVFGQMYGPDRQEHVQALAKQVDQFRPDIVIVLKGLHLSFDDIRMLRGNGRWVCNINHDDFFSSNQNNWSRIQRSAIAAYSYIFTTREVNVAEVRPLNPRVEFFPFAYYPRIHRLVEPDPNEAEKWSADVVFVGTYEQPRAAFLEHLIQTVSLQLAIHGAQWSKLATRSPLRNCVRSEDLRFDDLCKALGGAKLALGFLRKENRDDYTQRTFEIPACGGVFVAERTSRHTELYREGEEAIFFDQVSPAELTKQVSLLLKNTPLRESIRLAGRQALLRGRHTYKDRLERLLEVRAQTRG
jgi:spore maturation protein CgeB